MEIGCTTVFFFPFILFLEFLHLLFKAERKSPQKFVCFFFNRDCEFNRINLFPACENVALTVTLHDQLITNISTDAMDAICLCFVVVIVVVFLSAAAASEDSYHADKAPDLNWIQCSELNLNK